MRRPKILVIGYGNPGRLDDGLGPALAAELERLSPDGVTVEAGYQLSVEDAAAVAEHDVVVFADAAVEGAEPFAFERVTPSRGADFTSHSLEPRALAALAEDLFGSRAECWVLAVRGYEFDRFGEGLSGRARENLAQAVGFLTDFLRRRASAAATTECVESVRAAH